MMQKINDNLSNLVAEIREQVSSRRFGFKSIFLQVPELQDDLVVSRITEEIRSFN